jgi:hypothetical protein
MTPEQAAQLIESRLFPRPSLAAKAAIREIAGEIVSSTTAHTAALLGTQPTLTNKRSQRTGIPAHISAVDLCANAVGFDVNKSGKCSNVPEMRAIAWMLRRGIAFPYTPSLSEIAAAMGYRTHTVVIDWVREAQHHGDLVARMYKHCEQFGLRTHPRPDWAKEAA